MEIRMLGDSWTPQPRVHRRRYREETCWGMIKSTFYHTIFPTDVRIFVSSTTDKNRWRCGLKPEADRCMGEARHFSSILPNRHHRNSAAKESNQLPYSSWNVDKTFCPISTKCSWRPTRSTSTFLRLQVPARAWCNGTHHGNRNNGHTP
jgi:hypothetical protein